MKVKVVISGEPNRVAFLDMAQAPRKGEHVEYGNETFSVTEVIHTPTSRDQGCVLHLRKGNSGNAVNRTS